ncbi:MAG: RIP metalloprotease RseP [Opitutae bacterium]|nr:RIP metalloprotease RseP [Opitutae bacterium]
MDFLSSLLSNAWAVFLIVLFFGGSIFVHELGHFLAARRRGAKVVRFSIGFGPAIWKWQGKDGVEYRLAWFPLGGYVMLPQLADLGPIEGEAGDDVEKLPPVSYATKVIVFVAGAGFNVLFAFGLACILWLAGQQISEELATTRIGYITDTITLPDGTTVPSPAREAGLKVGDTIRALDGQQVANWPELLQMLVTSAGKTDDGRRQTIFTIERDGRPLDITVHPRLVTEEKVRKVGILAAYTPIVATVPEKSYAQKLGLQPGDQLVALNGAPLLHLVTLYDVLQLKTPVAFTLTVDRAGQAITLTVPADHPKESNTIFGAGFRTKTSLNHENPFAQIAGHARMTWRVLWSLLQPSSDIGISKLSGPIGIGRIIFDASEAGFRFVLWIAILLNVNLAIFNLLPIPVLDGGQVVFATIARLRGRALSPNFVAATQSLFMVLLLTMLLYVSYGDVRRWKNDSKAEAQAREAAEQQKKAADQPQPGRP